MEFLVVLIFHLAIGTVIALFSRRYFGGTFKDYYVAGGRLGSLLSAGTYAATTYSAFMMVGLVGLTYATGVGAYGFELVYLAATVFLLSTVGYEIWKLSRKHSWISPSQMLSELYRSRALAIAVTAVYLFAMIPYLAAQVLGLRAVFGYGGLGERESLLISILMVYMWIFIAGMWSVALTDFYQGVLMLVSGLLYLGWLLLFATTSGVEFNELYMSLSRNGLLGITGFWTFSVFLAYTIPWAFFAITNPQVVVRLYLPKDVKAYRRGVGLFMGYGFLYTLVVVVVGLITAGLSLNGILPSINPRERVTPYLLTLMNPFIGSLIAVSIIAAAVSTSNSIVLAVSGSVLTCTRIKERLIVARLTDLALVAAAGFVAYLNPGFIVDLSVLTSVILLPLAPLTLVGVYLYNMIGKFTRVTALVSLIVGTGFASYYAATLGPRRTFLETIYGAPVSAWTLILSSVILAIGVFVDALAKRSTKTN